MKRVVQSLGILVAVAGAVLAVSGAGSGALFAAPTVSHKSLTLKGAKLVAAAAAEAARAGKASGAIAIVDEGGNLIYLERLDGTFSAAANISIGKARSAAGFQRDTRVFEDAIKNGRTSLIANPELLPLQGGVPIVVDGQVVGAIGVSGANSAQQDEEIAKVGAAALGLPTAGTGGSR